ncbi:NAD-binding protein [Actinoplanes aureus]|uniref:NAD-binding protein n=1 Tax=Actinoplanes aureus TaxID=2792083 RepID=A0A931FYY6_9ACTN|nr:NAD-binding protein [Actinoplanes aureus]MBG0559949.1 NAD-binding protein [Actinoplanes aureus]
MATFPRTPLSFRDEQSQTAVTATRAVFALIGVLALVLGFFGLDQYLARGDDPAARDPLNLMYGTLQLFVLGADPLEGGTDFPPALQIARFAAPIVTLYAVVEAARLLLSSELRRLRARRSSGHVVVCGDTSVARTLAHRLHLSGRRVVVVRTQPIGPLELRRRSLLGVQGDGRDPDVLRGAGVARAAVLYACADTSAANLAIAAAAARVASSRSDIALYAQIHEPEWALTLQARRLGVPHTPGQRLDFFHLDQLAVHVLLDQQPLPVRPDEVTRLLVAGDSSLAQVLLLEIARHWRLRRSEPHQRVDVDIVATDAARNLGELTHRHEVILDGCRPVPYESSLHELLEEGDLGRYDRAFLCFSDDREGLELALREHRLWRRVSGDIVVVVDALASITEAFSRHHREQPLLDPIDGRVKLFSAVAAGCDPALIADDLSERLGRLIHERFVEGCLRRGEKLGSTPALRPWVDLDEELRRSNRRQADDIGVKLHMVGCAVVPADGSADDFRFAPDEVELLAQREQERWARAARADGWVHGPERDRARRRSPDLVDWQDLGPEGRAKCRSAVLEIPHILADAGFRVVRLTETGADRVFDPA